MAHDYPSLLTKTHDFIDHHRQEVPEKLALLLANHGEKWGFDKSTSQFVLRQVEGWQKLSHKVPQWAAVEALVYPPRLSLEQCSSQQAALYKRQLVARIMSRTWEKAGDRSSSSCENDSTTRTGVPRAEEKTTTMVDLTGGLGVDFSFMASLFSEATYVEQREELVEMARHNFPLLGLPQAHCVCGDGTSHLSSMKWADLVYIDPARRDEHGRKTVRIEDCTPNVLELLPTLRQRAQWLLVKLSPMLDLHQAISALDCVTEAHVVAVEGECKEILLLCHLQTSDRQEPRLVCASEKGELSFSPSEEQAAPCPIASKIEGFLYEPDAAVMKAGAYKSFGHRFGLEKLHPNTHLYIGAHADLSLPARCFRVVQVANFQKKSLRTISLLKKANITVRNFPTSVAELRKRLKLAEGGEHYLFACTAANDEKIIIIAQRVSATTEHTA